MGMGDCIHPYREEVDTCEMLKNLPGDNKMLGAELEIY